MDDASHTAPEPSSPEDDEPAAEDPRAASPGDAAEDSVAEDSVAADAASGDAASLDFPVVGIGASAGGLGAFTEFLEHLPEDPGMAFVLVQHLDPDRESELPHLLQRATSMEVAHVESSDGGMKMAPNRIYVIPPGRDLTIAEGELHLAEMTAPRAERAPIDHFFRSLAESQDGNAVGIVLSGTGSGGTNGLKRIKEHGGITLVQEPGGAEFEGMPRSAVRMGMVDVVAPIAELAERLVEYRNTLHRIDLPEDGEALDDGDEEVLGKIFAHLRARTGHDFSSYKRSTMLRRVGRRMQVRQVDGLDDYLGVLRGDEAEAEALFEDLLISVTNFFRDRDAFERLREEVIPTLFEGKDAGDTVRVWATGCATGEEAYSLSILLHEHAATLEGGVPEIQVFATDLGEEVIHTAREGFYPESVAADLPEAYLQHYFEEEPGGYRVRRPIRETVIFARHDLMNDPPFSRLDLVVCRNLLIYLKREVQRSVFEVFHYALRPGGHLFLGGAESAEEVSDLFRAVDKEHRLYRRRDDVAQAPRFGEMPFMQGAREEPRPAAGDGQQPGARPPRFEDVRARLLEEYAPPGVVVDAQNDIVHVFEGAEDYLRVAPGAPTQNVLDTVRPALRTALRSALFRARKEDEEGDVQSRTVALKTNGERRRVRLVARPVADAAFVLVHFEPVGAAPPEEAPEEPTADALPEAPEGEQERRPAEALPEEAEHEEEIVEQLETELRETRRELEGTVEEYETSTEELRVSNEELQSMNEELRSTTEELETSKEELQSMNEELTTVNQELQSKNDQLGRLNDDLQNLLRSTEIATVFLDRDLRIQRYTPRAGDLFRIVESDRGRPLAHVKRRFDYDGLAEDAERVLETLTPVEREVQSEQGRWFQTRVRPYRTTENKIDGVVLTFVDVTERRRAEAEQRRATEYAETLIDTVREPLLVLDADLRVESANQSFYETFEARPAATEGRLVYELGAGQWDIPALRDLLGAVLAEGEAFDDFVVEHDFEEIGSRKMLLNARRVHGKDLILLALEDLTEREQMAHALRRSEERYRLLMRSVEEYALFTTDPDGKITTWSAGAEHLFGYTEEEALGRPAALIFTEEDHAAGVPAKEMDTARREGQAADERWHVRKNGERFWGSGVMTALYDEEGELRGFAKVLRDNTERKEAEDEIRALNETLEERVAERTAQVRRLASQLTMAEQRERRRIAAILHDDVQQQLYGAEMTVRQLRRGLLDEGEPFTGAVRQEKIEMLDQLEEVLGESVEATRTLSAELSPPALSSGDLAGTLRWLASYMNERYGLSVKGRFPGARDAEAGKALPKVASEDLHTLVFRLARELLFNVVKHTEADRATLAARAEDGWLHLHVEDAGAGFDPAVLEEDEVGGVGLSDMRERLKLLGGHLRLTSAPGEGTQVEAAVPNETTGANSSNDGSENEGQTGEADREEG